MKCRFCPCRVDNSIEGIYEITEEAEQFLRKSE